MSRKSIQVIENPEKKNSEKWQPGQDLLDFPRPFRWCIMGRPSCGKTSLILNYLVKSKPYKNVFLIHPQTYSPNVSMEDEAKNANIIAKTKADDIPEYKGLDYHPLAYIPSMTYFDNISKKRNLFIIDDIDLCSYFKKRRDIREERLNKLFSYVSSHKNVSIIVSSQDPSSQLPPFLIKMCNVVTVYQIRDEYIIQTMARKLSIGYKRLKALIAQCKNIHDSVTFDYTEDSPAPLRYNMYNIIKETQS